MVSKGNTNRKKAEKPIKENPVKDNPKEQWEKEKYDTQPPPTEQEIRKKEFADFKQAIITEIIAVLKPDMEKKLNVISTSMENKLAEISKQINTEMTDIRTHLAQPQTTGNGDSMENMTPPDEQPTTTPPIQSQQSLQGQQGNNDMIMTLLQVASQVLRPQDNTSELMKMFLQTQMRNNMSKTNYGDWIQEELMKKFANDFLGKDLPASVQATSSHFMKPIRETGLRAEQQKQKQQQQGEKHD
jgi:hypothetical protein